MEVETSDALGAGSSLQDGRYVIEAALAEDGFGISYRASDTRLERAVAMQEFFPAGSQREGTTVNPPRYLLGKWNEATTSFLQQTHAFSRIDHPALATVQDYFAESNTAYLVTRMAAGASLEQRRESAGGRLNEEKVVRYAAEVGNALHVLHQRGLLHLNVRPESITVSATGDAVLGGYGLGREFVLGQPGAQVADDFSAPELLLARRVRRGPYSDIYALAAICYLLLTGEPPAFAEDGRLDDAGNMRPAIRAALEHSLALDPANRPQDVMEFVTELQTQTIAPGQPLASASQPARPFTAAVVEEAQPATPLSSDTSYIAPEPVAARANLVAPPVITPIVDEKKMLAENAEATTQLSGIRRVMLPVLLILIIAGLIQFAGMTVSTFDQNVIAASIAFAIVAILGMGGQGMGWHGRDFITALLGAFGGAAILGLWLRAMLHISLDLPLSGNGLTHFTSGLWLAPGLLAAYVIRKPGVALLAQVAAMFAVLALNPVFFGSWIYDDPRDVLLVVWLGPVLGIGMEIGLALWLWRNYNWLVITFSAVVAAIAGWVFASDFTNLLGGLSFHDYWFQLIYYAIGLLATGVIPAIVLAHILKAMRLLNSFAIARKD